MTVKDLMADVVADRHEISFRLSRARRGGPCAMTCAGLEAQFWLPGAADEARMLQAFADGRRRILAVAERKLRRRPGQPVTLTACDFEIRR
jgi:hypothetical protein